LRLEANWRRAWRIGQRQREIVGSEEAGKQGDWEVEELGSWEGCRRACGCWIGIGIELGAEGTAHGAWGRGGKGEK
jgi:hypothetical protein